jgi:hypothetical protein
LYCKTGDPPSSIVLGKLRVTVLAVEFKNEGDEGATGTLAARMYAIGE